MNELNDEWENDGRNRRVMLWSWDDIIGYLNAFPELQRWYYEEVIMVRGAKDLDQMILTTIAMAFGRPAFEVPLHCESPDEFLQALSDTQRAVRTGELLDRESRHPIRKSLGGWREIDDPHVRDGIRLVDKALLHLRAQIEQGLKDHRIRRMRGFLDFTDMRFAGEMERARDECIALLDGVLTHVGLPAVR